LGFFGKIKNFLGKFWEKFLMSTRGVVLVIGKIGGKFPMTS
jgi:hypothetical protein